MIIENIFQKAVSDITFTITTFSNTLVHGLQKVTIGKLLLSNYQDVKFGLFYFQFRQLTFGQASLKWQIPILGKQTGNKQRVKCTKLLTVDPVLF